MPPRLSEKILICIGDSTEREVLQEAIKSMGYDVEVTSRAIECAQKILERQYRCVILDTELVGMDIRSAVSVIHRVDPFIPIIVAARDASTQRSSIPSLDPSYCLNKPIDSKNLERTLAKISK